MLKHLAAALAAAVLLASTAASAQNFPSRPVRIVVPFAAGGGTDIVGRLLGQKLTTIWGQQVVVENKPGVGGGLGAQYVAAADPDGYTLLLPADTAITSIPFMHPELHFDPLKSFAPVSQLTAGALIVAVNPKVKANTLQEFLALAKSEPGILTYGTAGIGSLPHLGTELLAMTAGVKLIHVPYTGSAPAVMGLVSGQVDASMTSVSAAIPQVRSNTVRALAVTSPERSPALPDVPTVAEAGVPGFEATGWYGLLAPAGTPASVVEKISADVKTALADPNIQAKIADQGFQTVGSTPAELATRIETDVAKWKQVIERAGIKDASR